MRIYVDSARAARKRRSKATLVRLSWRLGPGLIRAIFATPRIETVGAEIHRRVRRGGRNVIFAFWHHDQLLFAHTHRRQGIHVMVSRHADGDLITGPLTGAGFRFVRGSTTTGGSAALRRMVRLGREGRDLAITPDGPRGPRHEVQPGVITLARLTGLPILLGSWTADRLWELNGWDRFRVPKPFSRIVVVLGGPFVVPRDADAAEEERLRRQLGEMLLQDGHRAEAYLRTGVRRAEGNGT